MFYDDHSKYFFQNLLLYITVMVSLNITSFLFTKEPDRCLIIQDTTSYKTPGKYSVLQYFKNGIQHVFIIRLKGMCGNQFRIKL